MQIKFHKYHAHLRMDEKKIFFRNEIYCNINATFDDILNAKIWHFKNSVPLSVFIQIHSMKTTLNFLVNTKQTIGYHIFSET